MCPANATGSIASMTTTPDDQDWMRLAEEAFGEAQPPTDGGQDGIPSLVYWRYRAPVS